MRKRGEGEGEDRREEDVDFRALKQQELAKLPLHTHTNRLVFKAGVWYTNHLQVSSRVIPIVLVTPQPQVVKIKSCSLPFGTSSYLPLPLLHLSPPSPVPLPPPLKWYDGFDAGTTEGLLVVGVGDYLTCFWPDLAELHSLYESLEASVRAARKEGEWEGGKYREV